MMRAIVAFWVILFVANPAFALGIVEGAPAGFEVLDAPRPTSINLYYGGELIGPVPAHFSPGHLQFDQPDTIIAAIPSISDKAKLKEALMQPLPSNADQLCTEKRRENCGKLTPEIAAVIFDENHLTAELFINKNYLSVETHEAIYLPAATNHGISSVYGFTGAVNGSGLDESPTFSLTNNSVYSLGEAKLTTQSTLSNEALRFDTFEAGTDQNGIDKEAGLFRSRAMQLITDRDMAGVNIATSQRTRLDAHKTEGNDIIVYLPTRSLVSIYREGRLYSSHSYEAGNQKIDTSELPEGSYNITLRIQESDGTTREETRFFAKTQELPPMGNPDYYFQGGVIRKSAGVDNSTVPELTEHPILRFGTVQRVDDNMALSASFLGVEDRLLMEDGIFRIDGGQRFSADILASTKGDYGFHAGWLATMPKWNASVDFRKVWSTIDMKGYDELVHALEQISASAGYSLTPEINLGLRADYSLQKDSAASTSIGPYMDWRIWQQGENQLTFNADAAHNERGDEASVMIRFTHRFGGYGITASSGENSGESAGGPTGSVRVWHDDQTPGNALLVGGGVSTDRNTKSVNADADWKNLIGQLHGSVQDTIAKTGSQVNYGGNFSVNAAQAELGDVYLGGSQNDQSAVIIETDGDADANMKIFVGGSEKGLVHVGGTQAVYLSPYHSYTIRIAPAKSGLLDYDGAEQKITLYPGNVVKLKWSINKFYVVTGHIVDETGVPLANAVLQETKEQVATDPDGHLQAEMAKPQLLTFMYGENNAEKCRVALPENVTPINGVLIYRDALVCRKLPSEAPKL